MVTDTLLTEVERQEKYLSELPEDFEFPLFNVRHAVESQRRSGYQDTAAAAREIVDNSIEAGAGRIDVVFDIDLGKKSIRSIAFIDNGAGMLPAMIRYALTWGGGTHFDDHDFIGRFGFGLPNSSINQTHHVDVFSRVSPDQPIMMGTLDISEPSKFGVQAIDAPTEAPLPTFVKTYLSKAGQTFDHGTVVVWQRPDRLTYKKASTLREHLVEDFGITCRYHLQNAVTNAEGLELVIDGTTVGPVDPLFLTPGARFYLPEEDGGAIRAQQTPISVRYWEDQETGERHLARNETPEDISTAVENGQIVGAITVTIARMPKTFVAQKSTDADVQKRFEIRKDRRGMSFVRTSREIQTVDAFPRSKKDKSSGLGSWPLLQSYAYYWGIEVRFDPTLDDVFGITNDKQGVRPIEDFWRVLAEEEIGTEVCCEGESLRVPSVGLECTAQSLSAEATEALVALVNEDEDLGAGVGKLSLLADPPSAPERSLRRLGPYEDPDHQVLVRLLGNIAIIGGNRPLRGKHAAVVAYIALHGQATPGALIDAVWSGVNNPNRRKRLANIVSECRSALGAQHMPQAADGIYRAGPGLMTDTELFNRRVAYAATQAPADAAVTLQGALDLVEHAVFTYQRADQQSFSWIDLDNLQETWGQKIASVAETVADLYREAGDTAAAIAAGNAALAVFPANTRLTEQLMQAHHAAGDRAAVRRVYLAHLVALEALNFDAPEESTAELHDLLVG